MNEAEHIDSKSSEEVKYEFLYSALVELRNTELNVYWARYNILSAINFAMLAVSLSAAENSIVANAARLLVSLAGLLLSVIWLLITIKGKQLLIYRWDRNIAIYEEKFINVPDLKLFTRVLNMESPGWLRRNWDNINILAWSLPVLCCMAWILFLFGRPGR